MENATTTTESTDELAKFRALIASQQPQGGQNQPPPVEGEAVADPAAEMEKFRSLTAMPISQGAVNQVSGVSVRPNLSLTEREGRRDASGELIPISNEGIGSKYWRAAMQRGPEAQLAVIQKMYPGKNARIMEDGDIAVEITDSETGKPKDVLINPRGMEAHDLMDLAAQMPEIAAGTAVAIMTSGTGFAKTAAQIVYSALAGAGTGAVRDVVSRSAEGIPVRFGEIAKSRSAEAALDLFLSTGLLGVGKATRALSPFAKEVKAGTLEYDMEGGRRFFKEVFGEEIPATPADITGSPALRAVEAVEGQQPGARTVVGKMIKNRAESLQRIQDRALGKITPEESIGEEAISTIRRVEVEPMEQAIRTARAAAEAKGEQRVLDLIDEAVGLKIHGVRLSPSEAGQETLASFQTKIGEAKAKVDAAYAEVNRLPGGSGDVLDGTPAALAASDIRKELPTAITTKTKETGLVDESGRPLKRTVQEKEVLKSGVPEGLLKALSDLESLKGSKVSLQTLTNMKRAAYDEIAKTEAVPGTKDRWFSKVAAAYEEGIQKGVDEVGDPSLKAALTNAKETYKKELLPFDRPGVAELAKGEFDTGRLSAEQVADRLFEGKRAIHNFNLLKETLGANNPAFKTLKRSWADSQIAEASDPITQSINPEKLLNKFKDLHVNKPELAKEMFGERFPRLMMELDNLATFKKLKVLDQDSLEVLMSTPNVNATDFKNVVQMQIRRDQAYANKLIGDVADGLPIASKLKPTEFVKRIANTDTPTADVKKVLDTLATENPEAREAVATAALYRILDQASNVSAANASKSVKGGALDISATRLAEAFGRPGTPERLRNELLLGGEGAPVVPGGPNPTRMEIIENLIAVKAPSEIKDQTMAAAGGLGSGMVIRQALNSPMKYASSYAKNMFVAALYTSELGTKFASNRMFGPAESAAIANALIASEPFVRRVQEVIGNESAVGQLVGELKDSIDQFMSELTDSPEARDRRELEKFVSGQPAKVTTPR